MTQVFKKVATFANGHYVTVRVPMSSEEREAWEEEGRQVRQRAKEEARKTASMGRADFCILCVLQGWLSKEDALLASKGEWPASLAPMLGGLPIDPFEAQVLWATSLRVERNHALLLHMMEKFNVTPEEMDAYFGINQEEEDTPAREE